MIEVDELSCTESKQSEMSQGQRRDPPENTTLWAGWWTRCLGSSASNI